MAFDFPSSPTAGQTFSPPGGPQYVFTNGTWRMQGAPYQSSLQDSAADMSIGFRTSGNRFVVNDKSDLTGTDVMTVTETGAVTAVGLTVNGNITSTSLVTSGGYFIGSAVTAVLGNSTGAGTVYLRPNGYAISTGQTTIDSAGLVKGNAFTWGTYSATGATSGGTIDNGSAYTIRTSVNVTGATSHHYFYNPNGPVGNINTSASTTAYTTSSDERLKNVGADYDPVEAIAIIRADPVKNFQWKAGNVDAVGWIAQRSYAVNEDLATRIAPTEAGEKGEPAQDEFWGIDYGRRTPYLWAALTHALDRIDQLEARIAALEAA